MMRLNDSGVGGDQAGVGVRTGPWKLAILVTASCSLMTRSCVKIIYSGETSTITSIILMATCPTMGPDVGDLYKRG